MSQSMDGEVQFSNDINQQRYRPLSETSSISTITDGFTEKQEGTKMAQKPKSFSPKMSSHIVILLAVIIVALIVLFLTVVISIAVFSHKINEIQRETNNKTYSKTQPLRIGKNDKNLTSALFDKLLSNFQKQEEITNNMSTNFRNLQEFINKQQYFGFAVQDFIFDKSTLHTDSYISMDRRTISNRYKNGMYWNSNGTLKNYNGVRGSRAFTMADIVYFEVAVYYKLWENITFDTALIFEVGFSTEDTIDDQHYVGGQNKSWSFVCMHDLDSGSFALGYQVSRGQVYSLKTVTSNVKDETYRGRYGFYIDGPRRKIGVYDMLEDKMLHTFVDVEFEEILHPVFGVFNGQLVEANVTLYTRQYIKNIPKWLITMQLN